MSNRSDSDRHNPPPSPIDDATLKARADAELTRSLGSWPPHFTPDDISRIKESMGRIGEQYGGAMACLGQISAELSRQSRRPAACAERSPPMSKAQLAKLLLNRKTARARDGAELFAEHDIRRETSTLWSISLDNMDAATRARLLQKQK